MKRRQLKQQQQRPAERIKPPRRVHQFARTARGAESNEPDRGPAAASLALPVWRAPPGGQRRPPGRRSASRAATALYLSPTTRAAGYQGISRLVKRRPLFAVSGEAPAPIMMPSLIISSTSSSRTVLRNAILFFLQASRTRARAARISGCSDLLGPWPSGRLSDIPMSPGPHSANPIPGTAVTFSALARQYLSSTFKPSKNSPSGLSGHGSALR